MKTDLATSIGIAVAGIVIAYFVCNMFLGSIEDVTYKTIDGTVSTNLVEPSIEVFNYKALNPTVEVYVGDTVNTSTTDCESYDDNGVCVTQETQ